ncbi:hypothetical protein FNF31_07854 [Cafeteria roenbergensis]|uniref:Uncharacterized protein n=1 Tax=Cafeteria roenbergensis TaxID=33653 RepID=A0A5A8BZH8_CAFRO|nr:hypothetical protein FNF31_07854 [Cafeteria roenbergensis]
MVAASLYQSRLDIWPAVVGAAVTIPRRRDPAWSSSWLIGRSSAQRATRWVVLGSACSSFPAALLHLVSRRDLVISPVFIFSIPRQCNVMGAERMSVFVMSCIVALASAESHGAQSCSCQGQPLPRTTAAACSGAHGRAAPAHDCRHGSAVGQLALATIYIAQVVFAAELRLAPVATIPSFVLLWVGLLVSWCIFPAMFCDIWRACSRSRRRAGLSRPSAWVAGDAVSRGAGSGSSVVQTSGSATARSAHQRGDQASRSVGTAQRPWSHEERAARRRAPQAGQSRWTLAWAAVRR